MNRVRHLATHWIIAGNGTPTALTIKDDGVDIETGMVEENGNAGNAHLQAAAATN